MRRATTILDPESSSASLSSFRRWLWLSPAVFAIHGAEDAPRLADWMRSTRLFEPVTRGQLVVALCLLVAMSFLCAYAGHKGTRWGVYAFVWMQIFIFLHGIAHLIPSAWLLTYTPGLVTGALLLPVSFYGYRRARKYRHFGRKTATALFLLGLFLYDPLLRLAFKAGAAVIHQPARVEPSPDRVPSSNVV